MFFVHLDIVQVKTRFRRVPLVTTVSLENLTVACVPEKHRAAFSLRSFLHERIFILLSIKRHNLLIHLDIAPIKSRFTREPLVTNVSWVNLTVACVPERHRGVFNLRSSRHENVFTLLFNESHNVFLHFDIAPNQNTLYVGTACHECFSGESHGGMRPCEPPCRVSIYGPSSTRVS